MMKKYNFESLDDVPSELIEYVKNVAGDDFENHQYSRSQRTLE